MKVYQEKTWQKLCQQYCCKLKASVSTDVIKQFADQTGRENFIKTATMQIMSTPEYQLC